MDTAAIYIASTQQSAIKNAKTHKTWTKHKTLAKPSKTQQKKQKKTKKLKQNDKTLNMQVYYIIWRLGRRRRARGQGRTLR